MRITIHGAQYLVSRLCKVSCLPVRHLRPTVMVRGARPAISTGISQGISTGISQGIRVTRCVVNCVNILHSDVAQRTRHLIQGV